MAGVLSQNLDLALNQSTFQAYSDYQAIINKLKGPNLATMANQLAEDEDNDIDESLMSLDQQTQAALLLHMLHTREEKNIDETALNFIEESLDPDEFTGLFSNSTVKKILDMIVRHYARAIRKRKIIQKEAEILVYYAVINFQCDSKQEQTIIKQCIIDLIKIQLSTE